MSVHGGQDGSDRGNRSVIRHFEQNFELSGFGSPGEALVVSRLPKSRSLC